MGAEREEKKKNVKEENGREVEHRAEGEIELCKKKIEGKGREDLRKEKIWQVKEEGNGEEH